MESLFNSAMRLCELIESHNFEIAELITHFSRDHHADIIVDVFKNRHSNIEIDVMLKAVKDHLHWNQWYTIIFKLDGYEVDLEEQMTEAA